MVYETLISTESASVTGAAWLHNITSQDEMGSSESFGFGVGVGVAGGPTLAAAQQGQGVAALLVMLAVLCFIFAYCCWGAPFCRSLCRRHCCCRLEDPEPDSRFGNSEQAMVATPTIILLPHGRMLVVDGTIFTQFQTDPTGLDLVELGDSMLRAQRNLRTLNRHQLQNSQGSVLEMDAETPSKDSLGSVTCFPPPTYESIYGKEESDVPPSYSDILLHRFANLPHEIDMHNFYRDDKEEIEMQSLEGCPHIVDNPLNTLNEYPYTAVTSFSSQSFPRRNVSRNPSIISNPLDNYYMDNELEFYRLSQGVSSCVSSNVNLGAYRTSHDDIAFHVVDENENHRQDNSMNNEDHQLNSQNLNGNNERMYVHPPVETSNVRITSGNDIMNTRNRARSISRINREGNRNNEHLVANNDLPSSMFTSNSISEGIGNAVDISRNTSIRNDVRETPQRQVYTREQSGIENMHFPNSETNEIIQNNESSANARYLRISRNDEDIHNRMHNADDVSSYSDDDAGNFGALADIRESRV